MQHYCMLVNNPSSNSLLNWILISILICKFNSLYAIESLHHLIVYSPSSDPSTELDVHNFAKYSDLKLINDDEDDDADLTIKPVFLSQSTNPLYLLDQKNLITLNERTIDPTVYSIRTGDHSASELSDLHSIQSNQQQSSSMSANVNHQLIDVAGSMNSQSNIDSNDSEQQMNEKIEFQTKTNDSNRFSHQIDRTVRKSLVSKLIESFNKKVHQKLSQKLNKKLNEKLAKSFVSTNSSKSANSRRELSIQSSADSTLKRLGIRLGKLMKFDKEVPSFEKVSRKQNLETTPLSRQKNAIHPSNKSAQPSDLNSNRLSNEFVNQHSEIGSDRKFEKYYDDVERDLIRYKTADNNFDRMMSTEHLDNILDVRKLYASTEEQMSTDDEISRLANFLERNLRIIGLEPVQQLFRLANNKNVGMNSYRSLIKEINSKLLESPLNLWPKNQAKSTFENAGVENVKLNVQKLDELTNDLRTIKRLDEDDSIDVDLLHEFEVYMRSKMRLIRRLKNELNHDLDIREKRKEQLNKSRKRRSRRVNKRKKQNRPTYGKSRRKDLFRSKNFDQLSGRNRKKKMKQVYTRKKCNLYSQDERCAAESEIHEQYVPFTGNDQQTGDTYDSQSIEQQFSQNEEENRGRFHEDDQSSNYRQTEYDQQSNNEHSSNYDRPDYEQSDEYESSREHQSANDYNSDYNQQQDYQTDETSNNYKQDGDHSADGRHYAQRSNYEIDNEYRMNSGEDHYNQMFIPDTGDELTNYGVYNRPDYDLEHTITEHPLHTLNHLKHHLFLHPHHNAQHDGEEHDNLHQPHTHKQHETESKHKDPHKRLKEDLHLTKELITNLLIDNKHKIFAFLKFAKIAHLITGKKIAAIAAQIFLGKGLYAKKKFLLAAYKKCYIKIRTIDMLLIPVGVGTLLTPLFLPLAPLALIIFGVVKLFTTFLCFLLAV